MNAGKKQINDIFNGNRQLQVPFFQRAYVWDEDLWERFLESMTQASNDSKEYFLGSLILKQKLTDTKSQIGDIRTIIDGQQRLTTLMLFLKVLYYKSSRVRRFLSMAFLDDENTQFAILHNMFDKDCFEEIIRQETIEEVQGNSKIAKAYNYFINNVDEKKLNIDNILRNISFVVIDLDVNDDEQVIFDTINSLGVTLTTGELLKNYLFSHDSIDKYQSIWKPVFEADEDTLAYWSRDTSLGRFSRQNLEVFLYAYIHIKICDPAFNLTFSQKAQFRSTDDLFNQFKRFITLTKIDPIEFAKDMAEYAKIYKSQINPELLSSEISSEYGLERLNVIMFALDVTTLIPYLLYILKNQADESEVQLICQILEAYLMRRLVCKSNNNNYSDLFSTSLIAEKFLKSTELKTYLIRIDQDKSLGIPTDSELSAAFRNNILVNNRAKGVLYMIESKIRSKSYSTSLLSFDRYSLEHLMPKKWTKEKWPLLAGYSEDDRNKALKTLGNLAIITQSLNSALSNDRWSIKLKGTSKKKGLREYSTGLDTMASVLQSDTWDERSIHERALWLYDQAKEIWSLNLPEPIFGTQNLFDEPVETLTIDTTPKGEVILSEDNTEGLRDNTRFSVNGSSFLPKNTFAFEVVHCFVEQHPDYTFAQLKEIFKDDLIRPAWVCKGLLASADDLLDSDYDEDELNRRYRFSDPNRCLKSSDGVEFFVSTQWMLTTIYKLIAVAERYGIRCEQSDGRQIVFNQAPIQRTRYELTVTTPSGDIIHEKFAYQTLIKFINVVGVERVKSLQLFAKKNIPLIITDPSIDASAKHCSCDYYVITGINNVTKAELINSISTLLEINYSAKCEPIR